MRIKFILISAFLLAGFSANSQDQFIKEMLESFASIRLWQHEEIQVDWKMKGEIQVDVNEGLNFLLEGNPAIAENSFSSALKKDSTLWQAYYFRAASRKQLHKLESSEDDLLQVLRLNPKFAEAYIELAKVYHLVGKHSASDSSINLALEHSKVKAVAYYVKGDINLISQKRGEAVRSYSNCLEIDPNFHDAQVKLTMSDFLATSNSAAAMLQLGKVLKKDSLQKSALLFRSIVNYDFNKKQSIRDLSSLIRVSPYNFIAYYIRGALYTDLRNFEKAFSDFQFVIKNTAANENYFAGNQTLLDKKINLQNAGAYALTRIYGLPDEDSKKLMQAYCYLLIYNFHASIAVIDSVSNQKEPLAFYLKGVASEHVGNHEDAYVFYSEAIKLDDQIADAHKKLGIYEQELGHWEKSIKDFSAVLKITSDAYVIFKLRGISNFRLNKYREAAADFSSYLKYDSANKEVTGYRGIAYFQNKQMLEAYLDFAVSGSTHKLNYTDISRLINNLFVTGDTLRSMYALNVFTTAAPNYSEGYVRKFKVHRARNEWHEIEKSLPHAIKNVSALTTKSDQSYLYTLQGMSEAKKGEYLSALKFFDQAIQLDPKNKEASLEKNKVLAKVGWSYAAAAPPAASTEIKKTPAETFLGDWTRVRAELLDGGELTYNPKAMQPERFYFTKNKVITFNGCIETRRDYKVKGNELHFGLYTSFTIESITDKEIRLLRSQSTFTERHILIPTDSFTTVKKYPYIIDRATADTLYMVAPGIEPYYKPGLFTQDAFGNIAQSADFDFEFVVKKDGTIDDVLIIRSGNQTLNDRFIKNVKKTSGSWQPGVINGNPVNVKCRVNLWKY